ncbi:hypothetical protein [Methylibium sp.]|uniref:hypothetical protein n=1 Tax=Methylibium sp. TaxID=2067992 RepID=UPI0017FFABEA|nr:hypothetical protein [Methylibium sp.]MBA3590361.1 hypothetical protein [Methylibium sp.]
MLTMSNGITPERRRELAAAHDSNDAYLYQCLTGRRDMNPAEAVRLELATNGELRRWHLCQKTWRGIWPDLIGTEGAPAVAAEQPA